jgi:predicted DsbA family dithiol-disulfide isomerase
MNPQGQNLQEFLQQKYGDAFNGTEQAKQTLVTLGHQLGFSFNAQPNFIRYNSFKAHQIIHHARDFNLEHPLKMQLFSSYFTHNQNISNIDVLVQNAEAVGLNPEEARQALLSQTHIQAVREEQKYWQELGIQAIPLFIFNQKIFLQGAGSIAEFQKHLAEL